MSSPNYASILPLPSPRPTTSDGDIPISWLYTDESDGSTEPPEPTVAPSYPVLHACLVLGGDVPSCVAQAQLYGQLLYEHTVNSLQKPGTDEATPSAIEVIKQKHPYAEIVNGTASLAGENEGGEGEQPGTQNQKPPTKGQVIEASFPHAIVQEGGADAAESVIEKVPSKDQYLPEEFPHAVIVQSPSGSDPSAAGNRPEDYPHAQVIDTPVITSAAALPILQQVLNKVHYVQQSFPHAQVIRPVPSAAVNTQINNPIKDLKNPDDTKPADSQRENENAESVPVFPDDAAQGNGDDTEDDQLAGDVDHPEESSAAIILLTHPHAEVIEHTQATNQVIQNIQQVIQSVRPQAQAQKPGQDADATQNDETEEADDIENAGAHREFKKDAKAQLIEALFPHAQVVPNRPMHRGRGS